MAQTKKVKRHTSRPKKSVRKTSNLPGSETLQKSLGVAWLSRIKWRPLALSIGLPALLYFAFFSFYSWPWMAHFNAHFFTDQGDGFQNVWNMWWVNKAVTQLHQLPWQTSYLHYPYGTTLLGQTLNPFNGFVAIPLMDVLHLSLVQSFNIMVIFSFIFGGMTMFWLCRYFTKSYIPSLIGGFIFTFSSYHFAHAIGHMQLVSLEWMPLFILLWWRLMVAPRFRTAVGAAVVLLLVLLCDYYYFLYSVGTAAAITTYLWRKGYLAPWRERWVQWRWAVFAALAAILALPLPIALLRYNAHDMLEGSHPARVFSTDIVTPFLDGGFWHFAWLTNWYWHFIKAYVAESSIYLGWSVLVLLGIALIKRTKLHRNMNFWLGLGIVFGVFSLGPRLKVFGYSINHIPLPYVLLEDAVPGLKLSGVPIRMMCMVIFAAAIIAAMVLAKLSLRTRAHQLMLATFCLVLFVELWPAPLPLNVAADYPKYVDVLKTLPPGGVLDNAAVSSSWQLYDQTISNKPMALGYISRTPASVAAQDAALVATVAPGKYAQLCSVYKIRYLTTPVSRPLAGENFRVVYKDSQSIIYDLSSTPSGC